MVKSPDLYLGIMSGTSFDGIDIALIDCQQKRPELVGVCAYPMPVSLKQRLHTLTETETIPLHWLGQIDHQLGHLYADAVNDFLSHSSYTSEDITAIGCHGQTVCHAPEDDRPFTLQLGDANILAVHTGITTIADFRRKDMALGGEGAPLVPVFHRAVFHDPNRNRVVLNLGGFANITRLLPNHNVDGYDTGPANVLLDGWVNKHWGEAYDKDGYRACQGVCQETILTHLLTDPYFDRAPPKSTGREYFNLTWLEKKLAGSNHSAEDIQATLTALTAESVAREIRSLASNTTLPNELIVCGGGVKNPLIMSELQTRLPTWHIHSSAHYGLDPDFIEAMAFAWLAYLRLNNLPGNLPEATGAAQPICLGAIFPAINKESNYG